MATWNIGMASNAVMSLPRSLMMAFTLRGFRPTTVPSVPGGLRVPEIDGQLAPRGTAVGGAGAGSRGWGATSSRLRDRVRARRAAPCGACVAEQVGKLLRVKATEVD